MTAPSPAAGDGQASNLQRAAEVLWPLTGDWYQDCAEVAAALDAAEARGRAEMAAKIEALHDPRRTWDL